MTEKKKKACCFCKNKQRRIGLVLEKESSTRSGLSGPTSRSRRQQKNPPIGGKWRGGGGCRRGKGGERPRADSPAQRKEGGRASEIFYYNWKPTIGRYGTRSCWRYYTTPTTDECYTAEKKRSDLLVTSFSIHFLPYQLFEETRHCMGFWEICRARPELFENVLEVR